MLWNISGRISLHDLFVCVDFGALMWTDHAPVKSDVQSWSWKVKQESKKNPVLLHQIRKRAHFLPLNFHRGIFTAVVSIICRTTESHLGALCRIWMIRFNLLKCQSSPRWRRVLRRRVRNLQSARRQSCTIRGKENARYLRDIEGVMWSSLYFWFLKSWVFHDIVKP